MRLNLSFLNLENCYLFLHREFNFRKEVEKLLENGTAYYCFCSDRRLNLLKKDAIRRREVPKYDNRCRNLTKKEVEEKLQNGSSHCIRFKVNYSILMNYNQNAYTTHLFDVIAYIRS